MTKNILPILLSITLLTIWACNEEMAKPRAEWGYDYFPLETGMVWNYEMDSIVYHLEVNGIVVDSVHLLVRETLVDTLRDLEDNLWYRGERYDRYTEDLPWRFRQTFLLRRDQQRAFRREDNLEFIKMTFPVEQYKNWDGNIAFDSSRPIEITGESVHSTAGESIAVYKDWDYEYIYTDSIEEEIHGLSFGLSCLVSRINTDIDTNNIDLNPSALTEFLKSEEFLEIEELIVEVMNRRFSIEKYAKGIGLVYREMEILERRACPLWFDYVSITETASSPDTAMINLCIAPWKESAEVGFIIRQWLVE